MGEPSYQFRFTLTDVFRVFWSRESRALAERKSRTTVGFLFAVLAAASLVPFYFTHSIPLAVALLTTGVLCMFFCRWYLAWIASTRVRWEKACAEVVNAAEDPGEQQTLLFYDNFVLERFDDSEERLSYSEFDDVSAKQEGVGLCAGQRVQLVIPQGAFADMDQQKAFIVFVREKLARATDGRLPLRIRRIFGGCTSAPLTKLPQM